jgi:hypothetical protein
MFVRAGQGPENSDAFAVVIEPFAMFFLRTIAKCLTFRLKRKSICDIKWHLFFPVSTAVTVFLCCFLAETRMDPKRCVTVIPAERLGSSSAGER